MSAAGEECSFGMDTDSSIGCTVAAADSVIKDINDNDDPTVGCAIAHAAHLSSSNSKDISDKDDDSFAEICFSVGLKSDGEGQGLVLVDNSKEKNHSSSLHLSDQLKFRMS